MIRKEQNIRHPTNLLVENEVRELLGVRPREFYVDSDGEKHEVPDKDEIDKVDLVIADDIRNDRIFFDFNGRVHCTVR